MDLAIFFPFCSSSKKIGQYEQLVVPGHRPKKQAVTEGGMILDDLRHMEDNF